MHNHLEMTHRTKDVFAMEIEVLKRTDFSTGDSMTVASTLMLGSQNEDDMAAVAS